MTVTSTASAVTPIASVLVANRGEIARRVFRTARASGMRCVAVFVDADADAPFVREADEAVRLPDGYLDGDAIIAAAQATGAQAIHPGYGFLSENAAFARDVTAAGLIWVGPQPNVIASMGDKLAAKRIAVEAGVPTLPSSEDISATAAEGVGYPLLVKAAAGGGGKGMRVVNSADELVESIASAQREALNGFGDDTVFLERYVPRSRHIEIQIMGDGHGNVMQYGERECSIQRRHQKIIEEAPAAIVDAARQQAMGDAAIALGKALDYRSAGTVEFLVDDATSEFWFLEVNTRLQVEHPVTEAITGVDLVHEQLRIAAGGTLANRQTLSPPLGHAIEVRLYAEDPANNFLPAIGTIEAYEPAEEPKVRWDSGIQLGSVIGVDFDPMLAKVVAHAPTRTEAAGRLALALERLHLGGVTTNRDFLVNTLRSPEFLAGDTTTDFIERVAPAPTLVLDDAARRYAAIAGALWIQGRNRSTAATWSTIPSGWRNSLTPDERVVLAHGTGDGAETEVLYRRQRDGSFRVGGDDTSSRAIVHAWTPEVIDVEIDDLRRTVRISEHAGSLHVQAATGTVDFCIAPRFTLPSADGPAGGLVAPMPGVVLEVRVGPGDAVTAGQTLVVIEAMKMEHHMNAPADGVVAEVRVAVGGQVDNGELLLVFETGEDDASAEA